jgi:hypothetical protein
MAKISQMLDVGSALSADDAFPIYTPSDPTNANKRVTAARLAAFALGGISSGTPRQLLQTNASGTGAEWTSNVDIPGTLDVTGIAVFDDTLQATDVLAQSVIVSNTADTSFGPNFVLLKARGGSILAPGAVSDGDVVGNVAFLAGFGLVYNFAAQIRVSMDGAVSSGNIPAALSFATRNTGGSGPAEHMRITPAGNVLIGNTTGTERLTVTGNVQASGFIGNADTATKLSSARTFTLSGDVAGTVSSDLTSGFSITTAIGSGIIVDADINAAAAIAGSKIAPDFGSQNVLTTGTITGGALIPTGSTVPVNGMFRPAANTVGIATNDVERIRIDSTGKGAFGTTTISASAAFRFGRPADVTDYLGVLSNGAANATATFRHTNYTSTSSAATNSGTPYTVPSLVHFRANQAIFDADATITIQKGFNVNSNLTGATSNYGFYSEITSASGRWNFYAQGAAPNYYAGDVRSNTALLCLTAPTNSNATATATATSLRNGIRTGTPTANIDLQVPTGTNVDAAFQDLQTNMAFVWSVINLAAATHVITVTANTDHTVVGNMAVDAATSGSFTTRKTAANTFITYRLG